MHLISAADAARLVQDRQTIVSMGFRFAQAPEGLLRALGERYRDSGSPKDLRLVFSSAQGDNRGHGLDHLAQPGMLRQVIGGFYGTTPLLRDLILAGESEGYNLPQGQLALLYRAIAAGQPGVVTHVGLDTFVDPRIEGGKMNARTREDLVSLLEIDGREWLLYRAFPINVAMIRATTADELGNLSIEREAVRMEALPLAMAARNSGGIVIAQVERLARDRSIPAQRVEIPGHLVDYVVLCEDPETEHQQTLGEAYNPAYSGEIRAPVAHLPEMAFGIRKIIARRAAKELAPGMVVNLGQGMPEGIGLVASEHGLRDALWTSLESGVIGGVPTKHVNFGVAVNPLAIIRHDDQFVFYDGGGVDASFLGFAQMDGHGSVNVSKFNNQVVGCGGFIDICQKTRKLVFCGQFDAGKAECEVAGGKLHVRRHGTHRKFVQQVDQITYNGRRAVREGRTIVLITERAVFELRDDGWCLTEVAPGVNVKEDILDQMDFAPRIGELRIMDTALFLPAEKDRR